MAHAVTPLRPVELIDDINLESSNVDALLEMLGVMFELEKRDQHMSIVELRNAVEGLIVLTAHLRNRVDAINKKANQLYDRAASEAQQPTKTSIKSEAASVDGGAQ